MAEYGNILIANLASPANPGDQAILLGTLKLCRLIAPGARITVATRAYSQRSAYEARGCRVVASYPDVEQIAMEDGPAKFLRIPGALADAGPLKQAIHQSDIVFLAGGAYFYSYRDFLPGLTYLAHVTPVYWARKYRRPVIMLPQSYGPFNSDAARRLFAFAVKSSAKVFHREEISGGYLRRTFPEDAVKFQFMPDLALLLEGEDLSPRPAARRNIIGLTLRPWREKGIDQSGYMKILEEALLWYSESFDAGIRIIVQVQDEKKAEGDEDVSRRLRDQLAARLPPEKIEFYSSKPFFRPEELFRLYGECSGMISMRLHSALLSFIAGTPALVAGYQHKAEGILKSLDLADLYMGSFADIDLEKMKASLLMLRNRNAVLQERIAASLARVRLQVMETAKGL